ncbi:adhesion g-protein coupled receptor [Holotrichia oblita]|uniref:Mitochondria associated granulocyte macrophage csf signaling molecule n=2 Tax=Holotrichia oblita TaxID=644536 RepID=A0ACB9SLR9_HOLOL|nr:mitochondria associated granulocyte macrophage csf signaling molecule [Holotrichia oblita]KAI4454673.1 adhesion g-protein coupled receptor [Holotrichia oblita]
MQLFRENLMPQFGGKIPETAFNRDRLALNRFNQNGLYSSDGEYIEQRPLIYNNKHLIYNTLKVNLPLTSNGRIHNIKSVDTNYLLRDPVKYNILPTLVFHKFPSSPILSLNLLRNRKMKQNLWNRILSPEQILKDMKPHLHTILHQDD